MFGTDGNIVLHVKPAIEETNTITASSRHSRGVEDSSRVATVEDGVKAFDDALEEAVDPVGARKLQEGAEDLGRAEVRVGLWEGSSVKVVDESLNG